MLNKGLDPIYCTIFQNLEIIKAKKQEIYFKPLVSSADDLDVDMASSTRADIDGGPPG